MTEREDHLSSLARARRTYCMMIFTWAATSLACSFLSAAGFFFDFLSAAVFIILRQSAHSGSTNSASGISTLQWMQRKPGICVCVFFSVCLLWSGLCFLICLGWEAEGELCTCLDGAAEGVMNDVRLGDLRARRSGGWREAQLIRVFFPRTKNLMRHVRRDTVGNRPCGSCGV
jgi:hypothetical protein